MYNITKYVKIQVDQSRKYQTVDGFGVNINSKYWNHGKLAPVVDMLADDLGANLYRLDAYGKSNWMDPENKLDAGVLNPEAYDRVFAGVDFQNAEGMAKHLNARGIEPYITLSGIMPKWMCAEDGRTLVKYEEFAEMAAAYAYWVRNKAGIKYTLFGPLNETDIGPPEGPAVGPEEYVKVCEILVDKLDQYGLGDLKLVVAEQAFYNLNYVKEFIKSKKLKDRIAVFGMHCYSDFSAAELIDLVAGSDYKDCRIWMTEYGDLDQSSEKEWLIAYISFQRLMRLLEDGMNGALAWDAFDNYHDHDETWTTFGIIKNAWDVYEPKKRYFGYRHIFRFVKPGFRRIHAQSPMEGVQVLVFESPDGKDLTIVGYNDLLEDAFINADVAMINERFKESDFDAYRTTFADNCIQDKPRRIMQRRLPFSGVEIIAPSKSIFTITTVK